MLSKTEERKIDEMSAIAEELGAIVPENGWTKYALKILTRLQDLSMEIGEESRMDAKLGDIMSLKISNPPSDITPEEKAQGYYFREVNGNTIRFSSDTYLPTGGQPKAMGADDLKGMIDNARSKIMSRTQEEKLSGKAKNVSDHYSSPYPIEQISAEGENHPCRGFTTGGLLQHKSVRHKAQYAGMTNEEFDQHAIDLLKKKCGDDIWGYRCADGAICRFNQLTGEFAKGYPGGYVKSCFFPVKDPNNPLDIDVDYARNYFRRCKVEESMDD